MLGGAGGPPDLSFQERAGSLMLARTSCAGSDAFGCIGIPLCADASPDFRWFLASFDSSRFYGEKPSSCKRGLILDLGTAALERDLRYNKLVSVFVKGDPMVESSKIRDKIRFSSNKVKKLRDRIAKLEVELGQELHLLQVLKDLIDDDDIPESPSDLFHLPTGKKKTIVAHILELLEQIGPTKVENIHESLVDKGVTSRGKPVLKSTITAILNSNSKFEKVPNAWGFHRLKTYPLTDTPNN